MRHNDHHQPVAGTSLPFEEPRPATRLYGIVMPDVFLRDMVLTLAGEYTADSDVPSGYLDWHQYAATMQHLGIRQIRCGQCKLYSWPKELVGGKCPKCNG